jgi:D-lactate dehydrogenase
MRVLVASADSEDTAFFGDVLADLGVEFCPGPPDRTYPEPDVMAVAHQHITGSAEMDFLPHLKLVITRSTGFDHVDLEAAKQRGIAVCNVPEYGSITVAEFSMGLILSLTRRIPAAVANSHLGKFQLDGLQGIDLAGRQLGIVGHGKIGRHLGTIAAGFGMKVSFHDPFWEYSVSLTELLRKSDIVALCCPLTPETHHLINAKTLAMFRPGAYLVNTARGAVVDGAALLYALESGHLAGAALDVLEGEEGIREGFVDEFHQVNETLMRHPQVLVTPHLAFDTKEAKQRIRDTTVEIIRAFQEGRILNPVPGP